MSDELSMDQVLIIKLYDVLDANLENEQFGVKELTKTVGMSRAQLHRKLHELTGKSTSQFIREYRLEKAMKMLQNNVATASEISYRVGFKSPTYFNTSFHNYYGYPPGEAKHQNPITKENNTIIQIKEQNSSDKDTSINSKIEKISFRQRMILLFSVGLMIIIAFSYYLYFNSKDIISADTTESIINEKSIAIIPFKNLSEDNDDEYFAKGMRGSIQNYLSKIAGLKVISEISMEKYANTSLAASEIAKEVGVSYLLDGSVQKYGDSIRIIIHFIGAKDDQQLSSMVFDEEFNHLFAIQSNIAKQVAEDLNITLSPSELEEIEKNPTDKLEAYNLWLQANFHGSKRTIDGFDNAVIFYEQAIALDSTFFNAYFNYGCLWLWSGAIYGTTNQQEAWQNAKRLLKKAEQLDSTYSQKINNRLLDGLYIYEWDFNLMKKEYKNSSFVAAYLIQTGRYEESLARINQIIQEDPTRGFWYAYKAIALFYLNRKEEALNVLKRNDRLYNDDMDYLREASKYYFHLEEYEKSRVLLEKIMTKFPDHQPIILWLKAVYEEMNGNKEGALRYLGELQRKYEDEESGSPAWFIALYYCTKNDYENTFIWLQKSYDLHEVEMIWLREEPLLIPLRNDKRYKRLYKKVGFPMGQHKPAR